MLEYLEQFKNIKMDCLIFISGEKKDTIHIEGSDYRNPGEKVGGSELGDSYHVVLYKHDDETDKIHSQDRYEAILIDPLEYISGLIPAGFYGMVAKKTTTSDEFVDKIFDKLLKGVLE